MDEKKTEIEKNELNEENLEEVNGGIIATIMRNTIEGGTFMARGDGPDQ